MNKILKIIGLLLVGGGAFLISLIYSPVLREEFRYRATVVKQQIKEEKEIEPVSADFGLVIPKIEINAKVFSNVDATNPKEYLPLLSQGVAHAKGSNLPGEGGNVFIFAHSSDTPLNVTRYNAVFYLIGKLEKDDEIFVYYQDKKYLYKVIEKKIVSPEKLGDYLKTLKGNTLTLQTCTPPGTTINRLLVIAKAVE